MCFRPINLEPLQISQDELIHQIGNITFLQDNDNNNNNNNNNNNIYYLYCAFSIKYSKAHHNSN